MKKIVVTEKQLGMIGEFVENESTNSTETITESSSDNQYRRDDIEVRVGYHDVKFNGEEIEYASCGNISMVYYIDQEHRSWGIKSIYLYGISSVNDELELEINTISDGNEEGDFKQEEHMITVSVDWDKVLEVEEIHAEGVITIGDVLELTLSNDQEGNIIVTKAEIEAYTL